ncbi:hypothetical protein GCM10009682_04310 [Luedemannella flava]|uniref:DUF4175 domain-containing protein n=1 Tax=Luedemannella flava TaxID=349316 RepID=A0ABN2LE69_9ACTN
MNRHRTDAVSLGFGLIFLFIVVAWLGGSYLDVGLPNLGWLLALALIGLGLFGVLVNLRPRREPAAATPTSGAPAVADPDDKPEPTI